MVFHMEPHQFAQRVARNVADAMDKAGLSQRDVAAATGIPLPTLNRRLNAQPGRKPLDTEELYAIAQVVKVPVETLVAVA